MQRFLLSRALPGACTRSWQTVAHRNRRVMVGGGLEVAVGAAFRATGGERDQGDEWAASEASTSSSASSSAPSSAPSSASASSKAATMAPRGKGTLYVVGTPIGNLSDMSVRAIDTLRNADKILCEDTRRTKQLLNHFEIHGARLESYHMHNEYQRTSSVISELLRGQQVALVSDAGMPGINDPGALVIKEAVRHEDDIDVVPIPGPSAFLAALVGSGLLEDSFQYCGFVAAKRWVLKSRSTNLWAPKPMPKPRPKPSCSRAGLRTRSLPPLPLPLRPLARQVATAEAVRGTQATRSRAGVLCEPARVGGESEGCSRGVRGGAAVLLGARADQTPRGVYPRDARGDLGDARRRLGA